MLDFCCYGALVARWYIDRPAVAAVGMRANLNSQWSDADDNGAILVRFPKAMALLEGSWTTLDHGVPTGPIVYGTTGTLVLDRGAPETIRLERGGGQTMTFEPPPLPDGQSNIAQALIHHLETGEPLHPTLQVGLNIEVTAILDAARRSAESAQVELVDNTTWRIG
jgi:predicted dehydrogenase